MRLFVFISLVLLSFSAPSFAQKPPIPERKDDLDSIQSKLNSEQKKAAALKKTLGSAEKDLSQTKKDLVNIAQEMRSNEISLQNLETRIKKLTAEQIDLSERLEEDQGSIASLIIALQRLKRTPTESLIVKPGAPLQTAQTAMLLESTLPAVYGRAGALSKDLQRLASITLSLEEDKRAAHQTKNELNKKHEQIKNLVKKRETIMRNTRSDYDYQKQKIDRLSAEAKTLMELIDKLEKHRNQSKAPARQIAYSNIPELGKIRLPAIGSITTRFGQADEIGAPSQGIKIESQPNAMVISPMGGIVRFAGFFKNYGNMVIIEHKNGYHSLIAGLNSVNTTVESQVKAGEPIGQLPVSSSRGGRPRLYYELRSNGQPIDPARRFSELKS